VEAEPTHFQWMLQHFRDNGLDPADHDLIEAAVSERSGAPGFTSARPQAGMGNPSFAMKALTRRRTRDRIQQREGQIGKDGRYLGGYPALSKNRLLAPWMCKGRSLMYFPRTRGS
jgi:hypothetical protein